MIGSDWIFFKRRFIDPQFLFFQVKSYLPLSSLYFIRLFYLSNLSILHRSCTHRQRSLPIEQNDQAKVTFIIEMSQYSQTFDRESVLCPEEVSIDLGGQLSGLKMSYLVNEKEDLEIELMELKQNNSMLRKINASISIDSPTDITVLVERNEELEQSICKLGKEVKSARAELFLFNQISTQDENDQREIYKNYQDKILELRRAVQVKEVSIQDLQNKITGKSKNDTFITPQKSVIDYCQLVSQARQKLKEAEKENGHLKKQVETLKEKNLKFQKKIAKIQSLLESKCSFLEYRNIMNEKTSQSCPKQNVSLFQNKAQKPNNSEITVSRTDIEMQNVSLNGENSYDTLSYLTRHDISVLDKTIKIIRTKTNIIQNLQHKNRNLIKINQAQLEQLRKLRESNLCYQKSRKQINDKAQLNKISAAMMMEYMSQRESSKQIFNQIKQYEDKDNELKLLKIKVKTRDSALLPRALLKKEWDNEKKILQQKIKSLRGNKKQRSYSCIIGYIFRFDQTVGLANTKQRETSFGDFEDDLLFSEGQEKEFQPIQAINKNNGKFKESYHIFEDAFFSL